MSKPRIAIVTHGGIGGGIFSQGQPPIQELVSKLYQEYQVDIYSHTLFNSAFKPIDFEIYSPSKWIRYGWLRWFILLFKIIQKHVFHPYQIVYALWGYPSGVLVVLLAKWFGIHSIIHLQGGDAVCIESIKYGVFCKRRVAMLCRWAYKHASRIIALTHYQVSHLRLNGVSREITIIPYGPDPKRFSFKIKDFAVPEIIFVHIANHTPIKDQLTLLRAYSIIQKEKRNVKLKIIGHDAMEGQLRREVEQMSIEESVLFIEYLPNEKIPEQLGKAHVLLHTSLYEGQGMVLAEAASCGLLLAGTNVGMLYDMGKDCGIIVEAGCYQQLAQELLEVLTSPETATNYIRNAKTWIEAHDAIWTADRIKELINELLVRN